MAGYKVKITNATASPTPKTDKIVQEEKRMA